MNLDKLKQFFNWTIDEALQSQYYWYIVLAFAFLLFFLWVLRKAKKDLLCVFSDDDGKVQITSHALHELVKKNCEEMHNVYNPSTTVSKSKNAMRLCVRLQVGTDCNLKETRAELKQKLERVMVEKLNFQNFEGIDIIIKGFQKKYE